MMRLDTMPYTARPLPTGTIGLARFGLAPLGSERTRDAVETALLADLAGYQGKDARFGALPSTRDTLIALVAKRTIARSRKAVVETGAAPLGAAKMAGLEAAANERTSLEQELRAGLKATRTDRTGITERLVFHWANHFTVSQDKGKVKWAIGAYPREVIRPHLLGRFEGMLFAAVTHPSMLYYLENDGSIGAGSVAGLRSGRGLNENLAREVLELHTLGVDGGYTQADVIALAKILSGWAVDIQPNSPTCGTTIFDPRRHEPGDKLLLGHRFTESGRDELVEALRFLAAHPATARNVSRRLVGSFLSEPAPPAVVDTIATSFRTTDGDLGAVTRALIGIDAMWSTPPTKLRAPIELLYVADRLLGTYPSPPTLIVAMQAMGQPFLRAPSPKGWAEEDDAWLSSDGIKSRLDWAAEIGTNAADRFPDAVVKDAAASGALSRDTVSAIHGAETPDQALALLLMSPELQRR